MKLYLFIIFFLFLRITDKIYKYCNRGVTTSNVMSVYNTALLSVSGHLGASLDFTDALALDLTSL